MITLSALDETRFYVRQRLRRLYMMVTMRDCFVCVCFGGHVSIILNLGK